ncbi:MAG: CPBP family intramembrane metalloprotease [Gammaproteobacteria bacterium]|nr:CPBP family intramembrane metalloprotease [Gammaproteobacteria bacterium]
MFNWVVFLTIIAICIPGIAFFIPTIGIMYESIKQKLPATKKIPSVKKFILISIIQTFVFISIAAAFGTAVINKVNLHAPLIKAFVNNKSIWLALQPKLIHTIIISAGGAIIFLMVYYLVVRPNLDAQTIKCMERLRMSVGIWGRIFYGGVVEEILCRWGLMTFFVWLGILFLGDKNTMILWTAIILSGVLFGIGHLPGYLTFGCKKTPAFITSVIGLNLWAAIIFGWLFWHYGLWAAIIAHILFHLFWYPFDLYYQRKSLIHKTTKHEGTAI